MIESNRKYLKILYVAHERKLGGATQSLIALLEEMIAKGHSVCVVVPTSNCPLAEELKKRGVAFIPCFFAWWMYPASWNILYKLAFRMLYLFEPLQIGYVHCYLKRMDFQPDLIHTNASVTDFGARLAKQIGVKHIWHIREYGDVDYNLKYMCGRSLTWEWMNESADKMLFISKDLLGYFSDVAQTEKCSVVYNGIAEKYAVEKEQHDGPIEFVLASNINRSKNHMLVLEAAKILIDEGYTNFHINIAGAASIISDSKQYEEELRNYVKANDLAQYISFLGKVDNMPELRSKSDIEIVPSKREAFGRVTVEAMLARMSVIASDAGANSELVQDGLTGLLFRNDDKRNLADAMKTYIDKPDLIKVHGDKAYDRAKVFFMASRNADEIEQVYFELMKYN